MYKNINSKKLKKSSKKKHTHTRIFKLLQKFWFYTKDKFIIVHLGSSGRISSILAFKASKVLDFTYPGIVYYIINRK